MRGCPCAPAGLRHFAAARARPTANAAAGLVRAFELSPQDPGLRMAVAYQFIVDGKVQDARRMLLPLAYDPHIPRDKNGAAKIVAMIDEGKPTAEILSQSSRGEKDDPDN